MKRNTILNASILFSLFLLSCSDNAKKYNWNNSETLINKYTKCSEWNDNQGQEYDSACKCEKQYNLQFPTQNVKYGKLIYNTSDIGEGFTYNDSFILLDSLFIKELRIITQDSSNFVWGELGTQYTGCIMEFYNNKNQLINRAELTWGGMISTTPKLNSIKWGLLNEKGYKLIFNLLDKY